MGFLTILKFIFSKSGMYVLLIGAAVAGALYISHLINSKNDIIANQKLSIVTLESNQEKLTLAIQELKQSAIDQARVLQDYTDQLAVTDSENIQISKALIAVKSKLAIRDLGKLKESSHNELVLKIINRSISKKTKEWNN